MKKSILFTGIVAGMLCFPSCKEDDKTILQTPTSFVLNTPPYAENYLYDLEKSTAIELTCSQPDYGYTAVTTYQVQVSLTPDFKTAESFETLKTTYTMAKMEVKASEVAVAATNLGLAAGKAEEDFPLTLPVYLRLRATVANGLEPITSNIVELSNCRLHFALPPVELPTEMNMVGSALGGWEWGSHAIEMVPVHSTPGAFWHIVYLEENGEIKFNEIKEDSETEFSFTGTTFDGELEADAAISDKDGNIKIGKSGWYLMVVRTTLSGRDRNYTVEFNKPNVYLTGDAVGNWDQKPEDLFSVPETKEGDFISPAIKAVPGEGGLRMCVKLNTDWWKTEFIFFGGKIAYRGAGNDQDRISAAVGEKVYLNFMTGSASLK
ncbi:MAG: SusF/SusE family outer membrane protein [Bacteroidales bacterium]